MKPRILAILLAFVCVALNGQQDNNYKDVISIEDYILQRNYDSALFLIPDLKEDIASYTRSLEAIAKNQATFKDYRRLASSIFKAQFNSRDKWFFDYIEDLKEPSGNRIDIDYVITKWIYIHRLRDIAQLDKSTAENDKLQDYINKFSKTDPNRVKAQLYADLHGVVMKLIEQDKTGKDDVLNNLKIIDRNDFKAIKSIYLNSLCDFLIGDNDLTGYIKAAEESLEIQKTLSEETVLYSSTLASLISAYIYKGGMEKEVMVLLDEMHKDPLMKVNSYANYSFLLRLENPDSPLVSEIFEKFDVDSVDEFIKKTETESKGLLNNNLYYRLVLYNSKLLESRGEYKKAITKLNEAIKIREKVYSQDLSNSIYNFKSEQELKEKEKQLEFEKDKTKIYTISVIGALISNILLIILYFRNVSQKRELKKRNQEIAKKDKEKDWLLKEIHHRIKNNFNMISGILDIQAMSINNEKARNLLEDSKNRIHTMALTHRRLYGNDHFLFEIDTFINDLVNDISSLFAETHHPEVIIDIPKYRFDLDTSVPIGLIVNELLTNAYKYALHGDNKTLEISVSKLESNEFYELIVKDNGNGLPEGFNLGESESLGMVLVSSLADQLGGSVDYTYDKGSKFTVKFKNINNRDNVK
ncbi:sensor histidine kinase [Winogradskyella sp.]